MLNVSPALSEWTTMIAANSLSTTPMFLIGLAFGTSLLLIGLGLGFWIGRKMVSPAVLEDSMEREQVLRFVRNFATWTKDFAGDFSQYQTQVRRLSQQVTSNPESVSTLDLQTILHQIAEANQNLQSRLDNAEERLESQTKELASYLTEARTDGLTGLPNRRSFDQKIDERFSQWTATKKVFCLGLIDIDFFKKINDTYGHPAGDTVLREIANQLRLFAQEGCEVARYGGEEFAVLIDLPLEAAAKMIDRLRDSIHSKPIMAESHLITVTISSGVSIILPEERIGKLVRRADESLYAAKASGRNRVFYHDGKLCRPFGKPTQSPTPPAFVTPSAAAASPDSPANPPRSSPQRRCLIKNG
jgi:diguanylate cyclase